jgi:hypothetical protein
MTDLDETRKDYWRSVLLTIESGKTKVEERCYLSSSYEKVRDASQNIINNSCILGLSLLSGYSSARGRKDQRGVGLN